MFSWFVFWNQGGEVGPEVWVHDMAESLCYVTLYSLSASLLPGI